MKKIKIAVILGGQSCEHEVSLQSAKNVIKALDRQQYEVALMGITPTGQWHQLDPQHYLLNPDSPRLIALNLAKAKPLQINLDGGPPLGEEFDLVFPLLHGTNGEDGTIQGLLRMLDIAFVGADVLGASVSMDKAVMKKLLQHDGLPVGRYELVQQHSFSQLDPQHIKEVLGFPCFVKPANMGSSVGVHKVHTPGELRACVQDALRYDSKVLIEEYMAGREIEVAVLGNELPRASLPGEILTQHEFYSYESKYLDEAGAKTVIPAELSEELTLKVQQLAVAAFQSLEMSGMGRVDFFLTKDNEFYVNELNAIPGFTSISMYPKMWEASGLSYSKLLDELIQLGLARHQQRKAQSFKIEM